LEQEAVETSRKSWWALMGLWALVALAAGASEPPASYRVRFRGLPERGLRAACENASEAFALRDRPPPTAALLLRRGEQDVPRLLEVLRAEGYYSAAVSVRLVDQDRRLVFEVTAGTPYHLGEVRIEAAPATAPAPEHIGLPAGERARARYVLDAEAQILQRIRQQGYPFPRVQARRVTHDPTNHLLHVTWSVEPGRSAVLGPTTVSGLARVRESYVRHALGWPEGSPFRPEVLDDARTRLMRSALFSTVRIEMPEAVPADGALPLRVDLKERRRRTVTLGVGYKTDEGAGGLAQWEHRNLFGGAERLHFSATVAEATRSARAQFTKPQFFDPRQDLLLEVRAAEDRPDAYVSRNVRTSALLAREWSPRLTGRAGVAFRYSVVDQLDEEDDFVLASLPAELDWNTSDDLLDPRRGARLLARAEPFYDLARGDMGFLKSRATVYRYQRLNRERTWLLAGRVSAGGIAGAGRTTIPADERFYAGGGSSIRGYAYQSVGPLQDDDPTGGRSLLETSLELRAQVSGSLGLVAFLDGGTAFAASVPDFDETIRWGAGVGVRYFTVVGPLRADVGVPLDPRSGIDRNYQLYVSIGQAF
jgi:translocation and assembly module TamA